MDPRKLVSAALQFDDLVARQFVKDAKRAAFSWEHASELAFETQTERAVYAALVELLATMKLRLIGRTALVQRRRPFFSWVETPWCGGANSESMLPIL
jgi:hypothetical protein